MAQAGTKTFNLSSQAKKLVSEMRGNPNVDFKHDWKMVTVLVGKTKKFKGKSLEMSSSWNFPAQASPSCEVSAPSRAELGHFNFRAETELTILTTCMSKNSKFLAYFPLFLLYHDSNQFHAHLLEFM